MSKNSAQILSNSILKNRKRSNPEFLYKSQFRVLSFLNAI